LILKSGLQRQQVIAVVSRKGIIMTTPSPGPLLSVRAALVLLIAVMVSLVAGILAYFAYGGIATAALIGGAGGGALLRRRVTRSGRLG
jgi:hypothetical protein